MAVGGLSIDTLVVFGLTWVALVLFVSEAIPTDVTKGSETRTLAATIGPPARLRAVSTTRPSSPQSRVPDDRRLAAHADSPFVR